METLMCEFRNSTSWTQEENKTFERGLAIFDDKTPNRWFRVAAMIPGKSVYDVMNQYKELVSDVSDIEAGLVLVPGYLASSFTLADHRGGRFDVFMKRGRARSSDQESKKGVPWTEEEHRRFLLGLKKHGKGDWRNISRNVVISKTPTQVASHAQKYYLRQHSGGKDKKRLSIHDITTTDLTTATTDNMIKLDQLNNASDHVHQKRLLMGCNHQNNDIPNSMVFDSALYNDIVSRYMVNLGASASGFCREFIYE